MKYVLSHLLLLVLISFVRADDGHQAPKKPVGLELIKKATVKVFTPNVRGGFSMGSGTIIFPRRADGKWDVLTAAHVVGDKGSAAKLVLHYGGEVKTTVTASDRAGDLAWLVTDADDWTGLTCAVLAKAKAKNGLLIRHKGWGGGGTLKRGKVGGPNVLSYGKQSVQLFVIQGDSGAGVFCEKTDEVVGVVQSTDFRGSTTVGHCEAAWKLRPSVSSKKKAERKKSQAPLLRFSPAPPCRT